MHTTAAIDPDSVTAFYIGIVSLLLFGGLALIQRLLVVLPVSRELTKLHKERIELVRSALASDETQEWVVPQTQMKYPFESWVQLSERGIIVAGQTLHPDKSFQITARDDRNLPRATVSCDGMGNVLILSHGQTFRAQMVGGQWMVVLLQPPPNEL